MDKRDKRVVGASVAAALIIATAILAVGWYSASRNDSGSQAGDPTAGGPAPGTNSTANAESEGRAAQPATEPAAARSQSAQDSQAQPSQEQTSQAQSAQAESTLAQPTLAQPTQAQPTQAESTQAQPTQAQPTQAESTQAESTQAETAQAQSTQVQSSQAESTQAESTQAETAQAQSTQAETARATNSLSTDPSAGGAVVSSPGQPATVATSGNLPTSPTTAGGSIARDTVAPSNSTAPATPLTDAPATTITDAPPAGRSVLTDEQVAALPAIMPPSFDVVRVNDLGDAVIAGRAAPRSVVIIYDGDREIGRVAADSRGEWVFVSDRPLVPGQHEIGLLSHSGPQSRLSDQVVVLIAPEPRQDIAGQPTEGDPEREKPLALLVPRGEIGATTVLQSPPAVMTERTPGDPASRVGQPAIASSTTATTTITPPSNLGSSTALASNQAPVSIDVVDYDEAGRLIVSGRSTPQSDVRLYLDNEFVGTARTTNDGSFQVQPSQPVEPGVYALRIDEVSPVGSVTARAETPFQRAREVAEALPGHSRIVVQPGNSLWRIARQVYGQGVQFTVIYQANTGQIRNPDLIYPGQIFNVPETPKEVPGGDPS